jgi:hypothetical protein
MLQIPELAGHGTLEAKPAMVDSFGVRGRHGIELEKTA